MRKLIVTEFITLDGVIQAPGGIDEDRDGGFAHGGWVPAFWDDGIGAVFGALLQDVDAVLLGRRTYVGHAEAFEPNPEADPFAGTKKYVVSKTLQTSMWRDTTILRDDDVVAAVRALKAAPGKNILTDGSSQLVPELLAADLVDELNLITFPLFVGGGKRLFPAGHRTDFRLVSSQSFPTGVVASRYTRA